jgi:hypothetical protein
MSRKTNPIVYIHDPSPSIEDMEIWQHYLVDSYIDVWLGPKEESVETEEVFKTLKEFLW